MSDVVKMGAAEDARLVIEAALTEAQEELAEAEHDRKRHLADAVAAGERCADLRRAIAAYHKALGRNADGSERKARGAGKEVSTEPDRAACTGATADSEDDGNQ
mgnify:CR=1 FL=1